MTSVSRAGRAQSILRGSFVRVAVFFALLVGPVFAAVTAHAQVIPRSNSVSRTVIVIGFVGGFVSKDDERHPEVQIIERLSANNVPGFHAAAFENRHRGSALKEVLHWLDINGDGHLSEGEKQNAQIILFGHSWGASTAIKLAHDLSREGIPVSMTIQVDSVNKIKGSDCIIPSNVGQALNFYQTRGVIHGCQIIHAADPNHTRILGSYRFEYNTLPVECGSVSWANRHFLKWHEAMDCDPRVWSQITEVIQGQIQQPVVNAAVSTGTD